MQTLPALVVDVVVLEQSTGRVGARSGVVSVTQGGWVVLRGWLFSGWRTGCVCDLRSLCVPRC
jgi:hypothetical protein